MRRYTPRWLAAALLGLGALVSAAPTARADTILTFEPPCGGDQEQVRAFDPSLDPNLGYKEKGFSVYGLFLLSRCAASTVYAGPAIYNAGSGDPTFISALDGSAYSIASIDLASNTDVRAYASAPLTFTGHLLGGGIVTQTFVVDWPGPSRPVFSTFSFGAEFTNLVTLELPPPSFLDPSIPTYQFSNVRLNAVSATPEPASWLLAATGLAGLGGFARYRRRPLPRADSVRRA